MLRQHESLGHKQTTEEAAVPLETLPEAEFIEQPPAAVYQSFHELYGHGGEYDETDYKNVLGVWVLHRDKPADGNHRSYHLVIRATDEAFMRAERSHYSRSFATDESWRVNTYDSSQVIVAMTDGQKAFDISVDDLHGLGGPRLGKMHGLDSEGLALGLTIDGKSWKRLVVNKGGESGAVTLPGGETGWMLDRAESALEASVALPETAEVHYIKAKRLGGRAIKSADAPGEHLVA